MAVERGHCLLVEEPYSHVLSQKYRGAMCEWCFLRSSSLKKCTACGFLQYCGKQCQKRDWKVHKMECPCLKAVSPKIPMDSVRLMLRLIITQHLKLLSNSQWSRSVEDLMTHETDIKEDLERTKMFAQMLYTLKEYAGSRVYLPAPADIFIMFCKMTINSFSICDGELQPIGTGLFLSGSRLDHSCRPNAVAVFHGTTLVVRAIERIKNPTPDKIFISYIDQLGTSSDRKNQLQKQYYFQCQCDWCLDAARDKLMTSVKCSTTGCEGSISLDQTDDYDPEPCQKCGQMSLSGKQRQRAQQMQRSCSKWWRELEEMKKVDGHDLRTRYQLCREHLTKVDGVLHPMNVTYMHLLDQALDAAIDSEDWENALMFGSQNLQPYRFYYGHYSPNLAVQMFKVGKLHLHLGHLEKALNLLQEAQTVLEVTHGRDHKMYEDVSENILQCTEELKMKMQITET